MNCTNCGKNAAKQYVKKTDGKEKILLLCPACYESLYPAGGEDDMFTSFLGGGARKKSCPACGTTFGEFKRTGILGCASCYQAFEDELLPTIRYIQGKTQHAGKSPDAGAEEKYDRIRALVGEREEVKEMLERAMRARDFAEADRLKVLLKEINHKLYRGEVRS